LANRLFCYLSVSFDSDRLTYKSLWSHYRVFSFLLWIYCVVVIGLYSLYMNDAVNVLYNMDII